MTKTAESILDFFEKTAETFFDKTAFGDTKGEISFSALKESAERIASALFSLANLRRPVALFMDRSIRIPAALLGVLYSGNFYVPLDVEAPEERTKKILSSLEPAAILIDAALGERADAICKDYKGAKRIIYEDAADSQINKEALFCMREKIVSSDPAVAIFTSGSTGMPKGCLIYHANITAYIAWFTGRFEIDEKTVFGAQTPFYFSMSLSDTFSVLYAGASYHIVPKFYFTFPGALVPYLDERKINALYWVPSAYGILAKLDLFSYGKPKYLKKLLFAGEVMPIKTLRYLRSYLPDALYANLFGPTETTDICGYYVVDREFAEGESLPLGKACENCRLFLVDEAGREIVEAGKEGELYAAGPFVALGYYRNAEKTREAFVQNPLQDAYPEIVYRTGDLAKYGDSGLLLYVGRKDFQIKRMGYRIELGEIEAAMSVAEGVGGAVCLYDGEKDRLILFCETDADNVSRIAETAKARLPAYMLPDKIVALPAFPLNANGKTDRLRLKKEWMGGD